MSAPRRSPKRSHGTCLAKLPFFLFPFTFVFVGYALFSKRRGLHDLFSGCKVLLHQKPAATS